MASWYERVGELLGQPEPTSSVDLGSDLDPADVELLLRAATDLLPPAEALELASRLEPDAAPAAPPSWAALVTSGGPGELLGSDELGAGTTSLTTAGLDLDFGTGAVASFGTVDQPADSWPTDDDDASREDANLGHTVTGQDEPFDVGVGDRALIAPDVTVDVPPGEDEGPDDGSWPDADHLEHDDWD
ncbi:MAG: hypothetical protein GEV08_12985 [Acidimicrobiia bacterium]|nr:hypothetical protein [Acidimicrobiia bacterium]